MNSALLGLPLCLALSELKEAGVTDAAVNRVTAPGRRRESGEWRVVRVREGNGVILDVCLFASDRIYEPAK